jgi:flagellar hook-basal body complex protein FliE
MLARIGSNPGLPVTPSIGGLGGASKADDGESFGSSLEKAVDAVNRQQVGSDDKLAGLAKGQDTDIHGTMIALEEANIALRAMASARDKVVDAYKTIWNMQV